MKKRILVTREESQAGEFASLLEGLGLEPVIFPVIKFVPPTDRSNLDNAINNINSYQWLLLTSANGVKYFIKAIEEAGKNVSQLGNMKVFAVGPKTAEVAEALALKIDIIPENFQAEGVLEEFKKIGVSGGKILFPRAESGRDLLPNGLKKLGAEVDLVPVYRTVKPEGKEELLKSILEEGIDVITFTSGSTVKNFIGILGEDNLSLLSNIKVACISEVTAKSVTKFGLKTDILPKENTTISLAQAIKDFLA